MEPDIDLYEMYMALAWSRIRAGDLNDALDNAMSAIEEWQDAGGDNYMFALGIAGSIYEGLGNFESALHYDELCFKKALEKLEKDPQEVDNLLIIAVPCITLGRLYQKLSQMEEAFSLYQLMYTISAEFLTHNPGSLAILKLKMIACESFADFYLRQESPSKAFPFCAEYKNCAIEISSQVPDDLDVKNKFNISNIFLGDYYYKSDYPEDALTCYLEAEQGAATVSSRHLSKEEVEEYVDLRSTHALAHEKLSTVYFQLEEYSVAVEHNLKNQEILERLINDYPESIIFQFNLSVCLQQTGIILHRQKDYFNALQYFDNCFVQVTDLVHQAPDSSEFKRLIAIIYQYRAVIYTDIGEMDKATTNYKAMYNYLKDLTKLFPGDPLMQDNLAYACMRYALFLHEDLKDDINALKYVKEGHQLYENLATEFPGLVKHKEKADMAAGLIDDLSN